MPAVDDADGALLERLRGGDEAAFALLVRRYHPQLLRIAQSFVPSRAVAEEVVQDTWLGVVRGIDRFEGRSSFKTWLFRILVNRARTTGAREARTLTVDLDSDAGLHFEANGAWSLPPTVWSDEVDEKIVAEQLADQVKGLLPSLPPAQRQVLVLRDIEGLDAAEVCALLDISDANQRVLLHRARHKVRAAVESQVGAS